MRAANCITSPWPVRFAAAEGRPGCPRERAELPWLSGHSSCLHALVALPLRRYSIMPRRLDARLATRTFHPSRRGATRKRTASAKSVIQIPDDANGLEIEIGGKEVVL